MKMNSLPPIAEPKGDAPFPDSPRAFRGRLILGFFQCSLSAVPLTALALWIISGFRFSTTDAVTSLLAGCGGALAGILGSLFTPIQVSRHELRGPNIWSVPQVVRWEEDCILKRRWVFVSYLVISNSKNSVWIPRYLRHFDLFVASVQEVAPADNVLRLELEK